MLNKPSFWKKRFSVFSILLLPAGWFYSLINTLLQYSYYNVYKSSIPIICVGNITLGGAGKTPIAMELAKILIAENLRVVFLSKGYKGTFIKPTLVDNQTALEVGDEPILLSRIAPCIVAKKRVEGIHFIEKMQPQIDVIICDDGLQNNSFHKTISLVVIDRIYGIGNGRLFPAGPLRETYKRAIKRCDAIIINGTQENSFPLHVPKTIPCFDSYYLPHFCSSLIEKPIVAFAGIGHPEKFFEMLKQFAFTVVHTIPYPDHYVYQKHDLDYLNQLAIQYNALLLTTEKDLVRIPSLEQSSIVSIPINLELKNKDGLRLLLFNKLGID